MDRLLNVLGPVLVPVPAYVFDRIAFAEVELVALDELNGLDL